MEEMEQIFYFKHMNKIWIYLCFYKIFLIMVALKAMLEKVGEEEEGDMEGKEVVVIRIVNMIVLEKLLEIHIDLLEEMDLMAILALMVIMDCQVTKANQEALIMLF